MKLSNNNDVNLIQPYELPADLAGKVKVGDKIRISFPAMESEATVTDIGQSFPNTGALILDGPVQMTSKPEITVESGDSAKAPEDADKAASKALADSLLDKPVVDTSVLTGSRDGLKSFLMKKSRDNAEQE